MALVGAAGLNGRDALIGSDYGIIQVGLSVDDSVTVKLAGPAGNIGKGPGPEGGKDQVLSDTGFPLRGSLHELDFLCDPLADGKDTGNIDLQEHGVGTVTDFLVNVEGLRIHVTDDLVFSLEGEEVTEGGFEGLKVAVIKFNASFTKNEEGVFLRDEITQLFIGEVADAGDKKLREVSIDVPALFQVFPPKLQNYKTTEVPGGNTRPPEPRRAYARLGGGGLGEELNGEGGGGGRGFSRSVRQKCRLRQRGQDFGP